jgi:hypothetical protein
MSALVPSPQPDPRFSGHVLQACPRCGGTQFRLQLDTVNRESFSVYRHGPGNLWRLLRLPTEVLAATDKPIVCLTCEAKGRESAFDPASGNELQPRSTWR